MIDAHALLWFLAGDFRLSDDARIAMDDEAAELVVPAIALAEAAIVVRRGRYVSLTSETLFDRISQDRRMIVLPITESIVRRADRLAAPAELHDRLIVAAAIELAEGEPNVRLITRDHAIVASGIVPTLW